MKTQKKDGMLGFHPYFDIQHNQNDKSCQLYVPAVLTPPPPPKDIPRYSFLLEPGWTPELLSVDRRSRSLGNFQGPYRESNPEPPVLYAVLKLTVLLAYDNML